MLATLPGRVSFNDTHLHIAWKDGRGCSYRLLDLRRNCPCALCRGGHGSDAVRQSSNIQAIHLLSYDKVGRYALRLNWSDSHDSGIYTYDSLRRMCEKGL